MDHRDWLFMDRLASGRLTQIKDNPTTFPRLFSSWNCLWETPPIVRQVSANLPQVRGFQSRWNSWVINQETKFVQENVLFPLGEFIHEFVPSDQVWVKDWKHDSLAPHWKGPYTVLTTPMAVKAAGVTPWIHYTRVKRAYLADPDAEWTTQKDPTDSHETKIILKKKRRSSAINCCFKDLPTSFTQICTRKHKVQYIALSDVHTGNWEHQDGGIRRKGKGRADSILKRKDPILHSQWTICNQD